MGIPLLNVTKSPVLIASSTPCYAVGVMQPANGHKQLAAKSTWQLRPAALQRAITHHIGGVDRGGGNESDKLNLQPY